jgi:hypothetical protein
MDITESERQMIELIREWGSVEKNTNRLVIEFQEGVWEVTLSSVLDGKERKARGVGATFDIAWDETAPLGM